MSMEEVVTLTGHSAACWSVCWHPHRPILASCSSDKSIRLYGFNRSLKASVFQHLTTLPSAHNRTVRQVVFSPDGRRLASASFDSTIGIWERVDKEDLQGSDNEEDNGSGSNEEEWENVGSLEGHESEVKAVAWSSDGGLLATCGRDKSVWIWDAATDDDFECLAVLMDHNQDVKHITFSPHEEVLASSSYDDTVKLYACDVATDDWAMTHSLPPAPPKHYHFPGAADPGPDESGTGHTSTVWASSFSPCGQYIASCSDDLTIKVWAKYRKPSSDDHGGAFRVGRTEKEGWYCAATLKGYHERTIFSVDWTDAGNWAPEGLEEGEVVLGRLASAGGDGKLCVVGLSAKKIGETSRNGYKICHALLASVEQAHAVHDLNNVQWCRLGLNADPTEAAPKGDDDNMDEDSYKPDAKKTWAEARNMLATAGDDGEVRVWRFASSTTPTTGSAASGDTQMTEVNGQA